MSYSEPWHGQDKLRLSVSDWISLLKNRDIFDEKALTLIYFVYDQPQHRSTATDIAKALDDVTQQQITALNRSIAKKIYKHFGKAAPPNSEGGDRWWNAIFDGVPENPRDKNGHYYLRLRDNLVEAIAATRNV